jgi:hypothetical protein
MANQTQTQSQSGGIGFCGALTILFIALKLTDVIDWSWWWVLSPSLIPLAIVVFLMIVLGLVAAVLRFLDERDRKRRAKRTQPAKKPRI